MATLEDSIEYQKKYSILKPPTNPPQPPANGRIAAPTSLQFALRNNTSSSRVYAYVTGLDVSQGSSVVILRSDGQSTYHPAKPAEDLQPLQADCAIPLGAPGVTKTITVPRMVGGRVWFVQDATLTFLLNRADNDKAALVEPSVMNPADKNYELNWSFCEFTLNEVELFANISYVDFVNHPISLRLQSATGNEQFIAGIPADGRERVAQALAEQNARDGAGWDRLAVRASSGRLLRAVSPNTGLHLFSGLFDGYYQPYVDEVWRRYTNADLTVNTQFTWGAHKGRVNSQGLLAFGSLGGFAKPSARDIFASDSGAFSPPPGPDQEQMKNIVARLAAAFNRATLLINANQPDGEVVSTYYTHNVCNHYSRIVHSINIDQRGYAFPYDDVVPTGGQDQAGTVASGNPTKLTIVLGGPTTAVSAVSMRDMARPGRQLPGGHQHQHIRRDIGWQTVSPLPVPQQVGLSLADEDEKALLVMAEAGVGRAEPLQTRGLDLERGDGLDDKLVAETTMLPAPSPARTWPFRRTEPFLRRLGAVGADGRVSSPALDAVLRVSAQILALPLRAAASRVAMMVLILLSYHLLEPLVRTVEQHQRTVAGPQ